MNDENLSGAFDYERMRWDQEQELLRADPAYNEWLDYIDAKTKQERESAKSKRHDHEQVS